MLITSLDMLAERIHELPTLPAVYHRVRELMDGGSSSAMQLGDVISYDPAITGRLLKLVNSSYYGFRQRINSVAHAIALIGFRGVENLILTLSVFPALKGGKDDFSEEARGFWLHSVGVAAAMRALAEILRFASREDAFTFGLLHDIGKVAMCRVMRDELVASIETARERNEPLHVVEREILGLDHTDVGRLLAEKWSFADDMAEVIGCHHNPMEARQYPGHACAIHLADIIGRVAASDGSDERIPTVDMIAWKETGLSVSQIETLMYATAREFGKAKAFVTLLE